VGFLSPTSEKSLGGMGSSLLGLPMANFLFTLHAIKNMLFLNK